MRPRRTIALLVGLGYSQVLFGQAARYADPQWRQVCEAAKATPIESATLGSISADKVSSCDSSDLYYGISREPSYTAALQCAEYERSNPDPHTGDMFRGPGVLTMLYANGLGVTRNYDTAIRFACEEYWGSDAEMALRVGHLENLRKTNEVGPKFDLCDDITSGLSMGFCTSIKTRRADAQREQQIAATVAGLPESAKGPFERLRKAEAEFEEARAAGEIDLSGTARGMFALEEQKKLRDQFLINLQRFAAGDVPRANAANLSRWDRALNSVYQDIQNSPARAWQYYGTVKPEGIRETERKWVALSDAWVEFAREAYPNLDENTVRAEIIRLRLHQLESLEPKS